MIIDKTPEAPSPRRAATGKPRPSAEALYALATSRWLRGERLDITHLASELGVARTTVFRWVGTREQLYGEVLSASYARMRSEILRTTRGRGIARFARITRRTLTSLAQAPALRTFLEQDPEFAIRVLTSKSSPVQARSVDAEISLLREILTEEGIQPSLALPTLAFVVIRLGEAFLYADTISGHKPEIESAVAAIRILVAAGSPAAAEAARTAGRKPRTQRRTAR